MSTNPSARDACEHLVFAYGEYADAWEAEKLAQLFTIDGVFNRLGTRIEGRDAIRAFIENRSRDPWQIHRNSNFRFELGADGRSAKGALDLVLDRGKLGETAVSETLRCRYQDFFVLTDEGWKFKLRQVAMV